MRIKTNAWSWVMALSVASSTGLVYAQADKAQEKAAEVVNQASEAGDKSFEEALDDAEDTASSLLSEEDESPYLFEYEYEYDYDSNFTSGFRRPGSTAADNQTDTGEGGEDQQDRIEEAQQKLAEAQQFAPRSRVREQFVQLGGESVSTIGLHGFGDLVATGARGLIVQPSEFSASSLNITLRGVGGTTVDQATGESGVGVFLDGVPVLRGQAYSLGLLDLESMDMLRGSRGVVAGRNAVGGAVYLKSRKPSGEFGFRQRVEFGLAYDDVQSITNIDLPRVINLPMARVSYLTSQQEGRVEAVAGVDGNDFAQKENEAFRIALTAVPSDNLSADFAFERSDLESTHDYYQALRASGALSSVVESDYEDTARAFAPLPLSKTDQTVASLAISYAVNENLEIKPIIGWTELNDDSYVNFDGRMSAAIIDGVSMAALQEGASSLESFENEVAYYEIQANGRLFNDLLNYSIGFTNIEDKSDIDGAIADGEADLESSSVYIQTVWALSERLKITAGIRDTEDEKDFTRTRFDSGSGSVFLGNTTAFINDTYTDYAFAVDFDVSKTLKAYASYSTAHKAGGSSLFSQLDTDSLRVYGTEEALTMQVGVKGSLLDSKFYFDIAAFNTDIEDRQLVFRDPDNRRISDIVNATDIASVRGAEFDLRYNVNEIFRLGAFITYLDTDSNEPGPVYNELSGTPVQFEFNPGGANLLPTGTAHVTQAPEYSYTLTADIKFGAGQSRDSVFRIEYVGIDDYHYDMFSELRDSRSILNARLLLSGFELEGSEDGKIQISLWGENLLDEDYIVNAVDVTAFNPTTGQEQSFTSGAFGTPMTYGMDIDFVF